VCEILKRIIYHLLKLKLNILHYGYLRENQRDRKRNIQNTKE